MTTDTLSDTQSKADTRNLIINKVGVKNVKHPICIQDKDGMGAVLVQSTIAQFDMMVNLSADQKGTHMSRFIELLNAQDSVQSPLSVSNLGIWLDGLIARLGATQGYLTVNFPYFIKKQAPVSGVESYVDYEVRLQGALENGQLRTCLTVVVPITSLCPCSKAISNYGAHNQRSHVTLKIVVHPDHIHHISISALIRLIENEASCEVYGALKRADEKYVTEKAYDNPKFAEDLVRDIAGKLNQMSSVLSYTVCAENFESIHNHSAYAQIEKG